MAVPLKAEAAKMCKYVYLIYVYFLQDEYARIALCENQQWLPLVVLLGLVGCSVPPQLKAQLLKTLAALAKSPEIASSLWQSIEVSQVGSQS